MRIINRFLWFLDQAFSFGGVGVIWIIAFTIILFLLAVWKFPKSSEARKRLPLLFILPLIWIFPGLWGAYFWYDWHSDAPPNPGWVQWPLYGSLIVYGVTFIVLLMKMNGARIVTALFGVWNLYFLTAMNLLATMAVTGLWI